MEFPANSAIVTIHLALAMILSPTLFIKVLIARMVQKLDLAENTRYSQPGFEDAIPTLRGDFLCNVT